MRHLFLLLFITATFTISSQEIAKLDSVVTVDLMTAEITREAFEYDEEDRLSLVTIDQETTLNFIYNTDGTINILQLDDPIFGTIPYIFKYDTAGNLDSISGTFSSYGYDITLVFDIESEGGQINRVNNIQIYGGYPFEEFDKLYKYLPDGKLDSVIFLDIFEYDQDVVESYDDYRYEDGKLTSIERFNYLFPTEVHTDTLGYFENGALAFIDRKGPNPDEFSALKIEYTDPVSFLDSEFIGPEALYQVTDIFSDDPSLTVPLSLAVNSRPASHIEDNISGSFQGNWYYTILVNTDEEEIAARSISVYPNPANDAITLEIESLESVEIYSMAGDLIKTTATSVNTIDISFLASGNYIVVARDSKGKNFFSKIQKI